MSSIIQCVFKDYKTKYIFFILYFPASANMFKQYLILLLTYDHKYMQDVCVIFGRSCIQALMRLLLHHCVMLTNHVLFLSLSLTLTFTHTHTPYYDPEDISDIKGFVIIYNKCSSDVFWMLVYSPWLWPRSFTRDIWLFFLLLICYKLNKIIVVKLNVYIKC